MGAPGGVTIAMKSCSVGLTMFDQEMVTYSPLRIERGDTVIVGTVGAGGGGGGGASTANFWTWSSACLRAF